MDSALPVPLRRMMRHVTPTLYDHLWMLGPRNRPIIRAITHDYGWVIQQGPFAGMRYIKHATGSVLTPKLLGAYESELHPILERALVMCPTTVIDIGSAEGYYAVGCALRLPHAQVYAFDTDTLARESCRDLAYLNDVSDRVHVRGLCTPERLDELATPNTLVICDCEGGELNLLDPARASGLANCSILVELHDCIDPSISPAIHARFAITHDVICVESTERDPSLYPVLASLAPQLRPLALTEARPTVMKWAYLTPKSLT